MCSQRVFIQQCAACNYICVCLPLSSRILMCLRVCVCLRVSFPKPYQGHQVHIRAPGGHLMEMASLSNHRTLVECIQPLVRALSEPWAYRFLLQGNCIEDLGVLCNSAHVQYAFAGRLHHELLGALPVPIPHPMVALLGSEWVSECIMSRCPCVC